MNFFKNKKLIGIMLFIILVFLLTFVLIFISNDKVIINQKEYEIIKENMIYNHKTVGKIAQIEIQKDEIKNISHNEFDSLLSYVISKEYNLFVIKFDSSSGLLCKEKKCKYCKIGIDESDIEKYFCEIEYGFIYKDGPLEKEYTYSEY